MIASPMRKVLVIDDELGPRESLRILLKDEYEVTCADCVDDGVSLLQENSPDVIIMDIRMPGKNGIDGLREIRKIDPYVSVIMLTGFATLETAQEALRLGANDYLKKPFETDEIRKVVEINVDRSRIERKRVLTARTLSELNQRLTTDLAKKEHMASLGQASAEFAHDIRNPLSVVQGYVQLLTAQLETMKGRLGGGFVEATEYIDIIERNINRCNEMVETWQTLGKKDPKRMKRISVSDLLRDVVSEGAAAMAAEAGGDVAVVTPPEKCEIMADGIQIFRVVQNVVRNAIQALTKPGGRVVVSCATKAPDVEICVVDNGCGIAPEQVQHLFELYHTTKEAGKGMGLGLFITKKVVEDHGGTIRIDSKLNEGTTVTIRLPLAAASSESASPQEL